MKVCVRDWVIIEGVRMCVHQVACNEQTWERELVLVNDPRSGYSASLRWYPVSAIQRICDRRTGR